jgi:hypothetical protein
VGADAGFVEQVGGVLGDEVAELSVVRFDLFVEFEDAGGEAAGFGAGDLPVQ